MRQLRTIISATFTAGICIGIISLPDRLTYAEPTSRPASGPATRPSAEQKARVRRARTDIATLSTALDMFEIDCGRFPTTEEGLAALRDRPADGANWHGPYIAKLVKDPWGHPYHYRSPGTHRNDFDLFSTGPDGQEGGGDDITNWDQQ